MRYQEGMRYERYRWVDDKMAGCVLRQSTDDSSKGDVDETSVQDPRHPKLAAK